MPHRSTSGCVGWIDLQSRVVRVRGFLELFQFGETVAEEDEGGSATTLACGTLGFDARSDEVAGCERLAGGGERGRSSAAGPSTLPRRRTGWACDRIGWPNAAHVL
jgi:hypothetical protein